MILHEPDWKKGVSVTRKWETQIERALSAKELRRSVADQGRYKTRFEFLTMDALETQQLRSFLQSLGEQRVWFPFWPDAVELSQNHFAGNTTLNVTDTADCDFSSGKIIIWNGLTDSEIFSVLDVQTNSITVSEALQNNYLAGKKVYPALYGRLEWQPIKSVTDEHARTGITFIEMSTAEVAA